MKKLTTILVLVGMFSCAKLWADETKVEITSFRMAGMRNTAAELCGKVTGGGESYTVAHVTVDEKSGKPGHYYTLVGKNGLFCVAVITYQGTAVASVDMLGQEFRSPSVTLTRED